MEGFSSYVLQPKNRSVTKSAPLDSDSINFPWAVQVAHPVATLGSTCSTVRLAHMASMYLQHTAPLKMEPLVPCGAHARLRPITLLILKRNLSNSSLQSHTCISLQMLFFYVVFIFHLSKSNSPRPTHTLRPPHWHPGPLTT